MRKLPVFATYGHVARFAFGRFFTVLRLVWLPSVALLAVIAAYLVFQFSIMLEMMPSPGAPMRPAHNPWLRHFDIIIAGQVILVVLQLVPMAAAAVALHRVILFGDTKPGVLFNFPFGAAEARYLIMGLLYIVIMIAVLAAVIVPAFYIITDGDLGFFFDPRAAQEHGRPSWFGPFFAAYIAAWLVVLFLFLRLAVWPASVVATGRLSPAEAWSLTRGNVWRLIGLFALCVMTMYAIMIPFAIAWAVYMSNAIAKTGTPPPTPSAVVEQIFIPAAPFIAAFYFLLLVFVTALMTAAVSYAYKALKGYDPRSPIPEAAG